MKHIIMSTLFLTMLIPFVQAQEVSVETIQFGTDVQNREVVGADSVFSNDVEQVYCFTHITGMDEDSSVTHIWFYNNEEMSSVELPVRSPSWRTWSSKTILPTWTGEWSVNVVSPNGELLATESFTID